MADKNLIRQRFQKSLKTYCSNAAVQIIMAQKLTDMLGRNKFSSVFEVGCGAGILTEKIKEKISYKSYTANDIVCESKHYAEKIIQNCGFIPGDIEEIETDLKFDLIISNACLQWCSDFEKTVSKLAGMLKQEGILAFSVFAGGNISEVKTVLGVGLDYYCLDDFRQMFGMYKVILLKEETEKLYFDSPYDVLRHLKNTGVNTFSDIYFSKKKLRIFDETYRNLYAKNGKVSLTYNPVYAVLCAK